MLQYEQHLSLSLDSIIILDFHNLLIVELFFLHIHHIVFVALLTSLVLYLMHLEGFQFVCEIMKVDRTIEMHFLHWSILSNID